MDSWQQFVRVWVLLFPTLGLSHGFVLIPVVCKAAITFESVGHKRTAGINMLLHEILYIRARPALERLHSNSPTPFSFDFHGHANQLLVAFSPQ